MTYQEQEELREKIYLKIEGFCIEIRKLRAEIKLLPIRKPHKNIGVKLSQEHRDKSARGRKLWCSKPENRLIMSRAATGQIRSPETRAKQSAAQKARWTTLERAKLAQRICSGEQAVPAVWGVRGHIRLKNGKRYAHRSKLERKWLKKFDRDPLVKALWVEPLFIPYMFEGIEHLYIPDIKLKYTDGRIRLIEIKPENLQLEPKNLAKWVAARQYSEEKGYLPFLVVGYKELKIN